MVLLAKKVFLLKCMLITLFDLLTKFDRIKIILLKGKMNQIGFNPKKAMHYEEYTRKAVFGYGQLFKMELSLLAAKYDEIEDALVIGCGTEMELTTFGNLMPNWCVTPVAPSQKMEKISKAKLDDQKLNNCITSQHGFIESLPEIEKYDIATLIFVMQFIPEEIDIVSLLNIVAKRLKPRTKFIIVDQYGDLSLVEFQFMFRSWKYFMKYREAKSEIANKIVAQAIEQNLITEEELLMLLSEAEFEKSIHFYNSFI